jgi:hypothetical protein
VKAFGIYGEIGKDVIRIAFQIFGVQLPVELQRDPIDKRLNRLDEAREALSETLTAVDELRDEIEVGRRDHQRILAELSRTLESKETADSKLSSLRELIETDQDTLREITAPQNVVRQHTIGFILGILASLAAAGLVYAGPKIMTAFIDRDIPETAIEAADQDDGLPLIVQTPDLKSDGTD